MTSSIRDKIELQKDNQTTLDLTHETWDYLKHQIYSIQRYPEFQNMARRYIKYKTIHNQKTDTEILDEIIYLLIMIEVSITDLLTIIQTKAKGPMTIENITGTLQDRFSLIETGLIDQNVIKELTKFLLHMETLKKEDSSIKTTQDELPQSSASV